MQQTLVGFHIDRLLQERNGSIARHSMTLLQANTIIYGVQILNLKIPTRQESQFAPS